MSLAGTVTGVLGMLGCSDNVTQLVAFAIVAAASIISYIIMEGKVDAAAVKSTADALDKIADMLGSASTIDTTTGVLDPVSRAIYDTAVDTTTTITVAKYDHTDIDTEEFDAVTDDT